MQMSDGFQKNAYRITGSAGSSSQYELKERKEISKIICNKCGKEIPVSGGHEMKGVFRVDYEWGYFSEKDGERHAFDLCETCYDALLQSFLIPVEIEG